jgi:8-oxo-dGTP pyrophosphatase MutT (NUDIX family)
MTGMAAGQEPTGTMIPHTAGTELARAQTLTAADFAVRARARLTASEPPVVLPSGVVPGGDHAIDKRGLDPATIASARPAAVLIPVIDRSEGAFVLLTLRTASMRRHSAQIALPGGKIDEGETALEAALREAEEEVGLARRHVEPLGFLDPYFTSTGYRVQPVVALVRPAFDLTLNPHEVAEAFEVPLDFLMHPGNHQRVTRESDGRSFLAMPFAERYIWGVTAGILRALYERLYP